MYSYTVGRQTITDPVFIPQKKKKKKKKKKTGVKVFTCNFALA